MRGEYLAAFHRSEKISELPPRARRILTDTSVDTTPPGTTSACAENTLLRLPSPPSCWNYLRVRGEYSMISCFSSGTKELPPRARRIQRKSNIPSGFKGTTSACAENTTADPHYMQRSRNYLRVRGEYYMIKVFTRSTAELPPRARRIPATGRLAHSLGGTTSACAENTAKRHPRPGPNRNYLRVCGEYQAFMMTWHCWMELPPRVRRIP